LLPFNPQACWDWWSYVDHEDSYVTKSGSQIRTIKAMLDALTAHAVPAPAPAVAPTSLTVIDASDTGADLAWTPQAGTTVYRVRRAGADGQFAPLRCGRCQFRRFRPDAANRLSLAHLGRCERN
jgi:poly(3-hydroxybutyrate) depolymerase